MRPTQNDAIRLLHELVIFPLAFAQCLLRPRPLSEFARQIFVGLLEPFAGLPDLLEGARVGNGRAYLIRE